MKDGAFKEGCEDWFSLDDSLSSGLEVFQDSIGIAVANVVDGWFGCSRHCCFFVSFFKEFSKKNMQIGEW